MWNNLRFIALLAVSANAALFGLIDGIFGGGGGCDECVNKGKAWAANKCHDSCFVAPQDVGCYTDTDGCNSQQEEIPFSDTCESCVGRGEAWAVGRCHENCDAAPQDVGCYTDADGCEANRGPLCSTDEDCVVVGLDPCAETFCDFEIGECRLVRAVCDFVPVDCGNGKYAYFDPLTCCGSMSCDAKDVCYVDPATATTTDALTEACAARGEALGEACQVRGKRNPECRMPTCRTLSDMSKCADRQDCFVKKRFIFEDKCKSH